ncbi:MAG TPA: O-antigen ligase family protein [Dissulfurispiraceae bacterium]
MISLALLFFSVALAVSFRYESAFTWPKLVALWFCAALLVLQWLYAWRKGALRPIPRPVLYSALAYALWLLYSTSYTIHLPTAVFGIYGRWQGLLTQLNYILLFLMVATLPLDARKALKAFVLSMVPVAVIAITQKLNFVHSPILGDRSFSTIGNPVIMGACLGLAVPFSAYFAIISVKKNKGGVLFWGLVTLLLLTGIITSESRGPELGLLVGMSVMIMGIAKEKRLAFVCIFVAIVTMIYFNPRSNVRHIGKDHGVTCRVWYAQSALEMVRDHPVFGVGLDCYRWAYPTYRTPESKKIEPNVVPTKAHNGYLQIAACSGIPGLLYYVIFVGTVLMSIRTEDKLLKLAFIASVISYLVQDVTGWAEVPLTAFWWVVMGLAVNSRSRPHKTEDFLTGS